MADGDKKLKEVKMFLRSVVMSQKEGVLLSRLEGDYRGITGDKLPFRDLGCRSLEEFLSRIPDVVHVGSDREGQMRCFAVADETTKHIQALVQRQKGKPRKKRSRGGGGGGRRGYWGGGSNFRSRSPGQYVSPAAPRVRSTVHVVNKFEPAQARPRQTFVGSSKPGFSRKSNLHSSGGDVRLLYNSMDNSACAIPQAAESLTVTVSAGQRATKVHAFEVPPRFQKIRTEEQNIQRETKYEYPSGSAVSAPAPTPARTYQAAVRKYSLNQKLSSPEFITLPVGSYGFVSSLKMGNQSFGSNGFFKTGRLAEEAAAKSACDELKIDLDGKKIYQMQGNLTDDTLKQRIKDLLAKYPRGLLSNKLVSLYEEAHKEVAPDNLVDSVIGWSDVVETEESAAMKGVYILRAAKPSIHKLGKQQIPSELPRIGTSLEVAVTDVTGPHEIYVHPVDWVETLAKITSQLQAIYKSGGGHTELTDPEPSMFCAANYSEDDNWYRAQILEVKKTVEKTEVCVHYIDFGNSEQIATNRIRRLQDTLFSFPVQALKCHLEGVKIPESKNSTEVVDLLYNLLTDEKAKLTIDIKSLEDKTVVVEMYCSLLGSKSVNQHVREAFSTQLAAVPSVPSSITPDTTNRVTNDIDDLINEAAGDATESLNPRECLRIAAQSDQGFVPVTICNIDDDGSFYIQLEGRGTEKLARLTAKITKQLEEPGLDVDVVDENKLYMAYSDGLWYRATLTEGPEEGYATAYFVDYGYEQTYVRPTDELKRLEALDTELYHLPFQAVECQLRGLSPTDIKWTRAALSKLDELTDTLNVQSTNIEFIAGVTKIESDILTVDLIVETDSSMMSVCDVLNREKAMLFADVAGSECGDDSPDLPEHIQYDPVENWNILDETGEVGLLDVSESCDPPRNPVLDRQGSTNQFTKDGLSEGTLTTEPNVAFQETKSDISPFTDIPKKSYETSLKGFENLNISAIPPPTSSCKLDNFAKETAFAPEISKVIEFQKPNSGSIDLNVPSVSDSKIPTVDSPKENVISDKSNSGAKSMNTSSLDAWLSFGATPTQSAKPKESPVTSAQPSQSVRPKTILPSAQKVSESKHQGPIPSANKSSIPARPILGSSNAAVTQKSPQIQGPVIKTGDKVYVTWVSDPHNIKIIPGNMKIKLKSLMADLDAHYNQRGDMAKSPKTVKVGEIYAGMHDDQQWYRCVVKDVLDSMQVSVQFIDYGDHNVLFRACLAVLPEKYKKLPPLAISAKLHGVPEPRDGLWSAEVTAQLEHHGLKKQLVVLGCHGVDALNRHEVALCADDGVTPLQDLLTQT